MALSLWFVFAGLCCLFTSAVVGVATEWSADAGIFYGAPVVCAFCSFIPAWQVRGWSKAFGALFRAGLAGYSVTIIGFLCAPFLQRLVADQRFLAESLYLIITCWILLSLTAGGALAWFLGIRWLSTEARGLAAELNQGPEWISKHVASFSGSFGYLILCGFLVSLVVIHHPKEPPYEVRHTLPEVKPQELAGYRELIRWTAEPGYGGLLREVFPDVTEPSPGITHAAPAAHALRLAFSDGKQPGKSAPDLTVLAEAGEATWNRGGAFITPTQEEIDAVQKGSDLVREFMLFLASNPHRLDFTPLYGLPLVQHSATEDVFFVMAYLVRYHLHDGEPERAVADYLLMGDAFLNTVYNTDQAISGLLLNRWLRVWISLGPAILPHLDAAERGEVCAMVEAMDDEFPHVMRRACISLIALEEGRLETLDTALREQTVGRYLLDSNASLRTYEQWLSPLIELSDQPYYQVADELWQNWAEPPEVKGGIFRPNPFGRQTLREALPVAKVLNSSAGVQAELRMWRYALECWQMPGQLPEVPMDPTAGTAFRLELDAAGETAAIRLAPETELRDLKSGRRPSLKFPLPAAVKQPEGEKG